MLLWVKAFHIIFMTTWFAGLFYLPRLFVYHAMTEDEAGNARFKIMERKLFYGIMTPGGVLTIASGLWMLAVHWDAYYPQTWLVAKLALVAGLVGYHLWCGVIVGQFQSDANRRGHVWYRWFNEAPVVFLVAVVALAVLRP